MIKKIKNYSSIVMTVLLIAGCGTDKSNLSTLGAFITDDKNLTTTTEVQSLNSSPFPIPSNSPIISSTPMPITSSIPSIPIPTGTTYTASEVIPIPSEAPKIVSTPFPTPISTIMPSIIPVSTPNPEPSFIPTIIPPSTTPSISATSTPNPVQSSTVVKNIINITIPVNTTGTTNNNVSITPTPTASPTVVPKIVIKPLMNVNPTTGKNGTLFTFSGSGFTPNGTATISFLSPNTTIPSTQQQVIDSNGNYNVSITGNGVNGTYSCFAKDNESGKESPLISYELFTPELFSSINLKKSSYLTNITFSDFSKMEASSFLSYGEFDGKSDIIYDREYGEWFFNSQTNQGIIRIKGALWEGATSYYTDNFKIKVFVNNKLVYNGRSTFEQANMVNYNKNLNLSNFNTITNWKTLDIPVNNLSDINSLILVNNNGGSVWTAIDSIEFLK